MHGYSNGILWDASAIGDKYQSVRVLPVCSFSCALAYSHTVLLSFRMEEVLIYVYENLWCCLVGLQRIARDQHQNLHQKAGLFLPWKSGSI
jgi:hypothetical protein